MSQLTPERRAQMRRREGWEPLGDLEQISERMRRVLEQTFGAVDWPLLPSDGEFSPLVDIEEADDAYIVEAEVPGVDRNDLDIELVGNELAITGEIREREHKGIMRRRTRRTGRFAYRVRLPDQVDPDQIEANLADGVLTVRVPKSEAAPRRKVEVKARA
jgi:HSP20 family protein